MSCFESFEAPNKFHVCQNIQVCFHKSLLGYKTNLFTFKISKKLDVWAEMTMVVRIIIFLILKQLILCIFLILETNSEYFCIQIVRRWMDDCEIPNLE